MYFNCHLFMYNWKIAKQVHLQDGKEKLDMHMTMIARIAPAIIISLAHVSLCICVDHLPGVSGSASSVLTLERAGVLVGHWAVLDTDCQCAHPAS